MKNKIQNILPMIEVVIHPEHRVRLERIDSENYSGVLKKTKEILTQSGIETSQEYLELGIVGLKQYYALALLDPANGHAVSAEIDPFWHAHMLFSEQYDEFSKDVVGGYMHHTPLDRDNKAQIKNLRVLYEYTTLTLEKLFGQNVNPRVWPRKVKSIRLICFHAKDCYLPKLNRIRLFDPNPMGNVWAFA